MAIVDQCIDIIVDQCIDIIDLIRWIRKSRQTVERRTHLRQVVFGNRRP